MDSFVELVFGQYVGYSSEDLFLEITAIVFGFLSVWYSKRNAILVFPTGMISTATYVYLLLKWELLGDMIINGYYFVMSLYGWYAWTRKTATTDGTPISVTSAKEKKIAFVLFLMTLLMVHLIYKAFDMWTGWVAYVDTFTTGVFFVGMWLMARRKIENWLFWIVGDTISVFLYFHKGFTLTSVQYVGFTMIAIFGYLTWREILNKKTSIL